MNNSREKPIGVFDSGIGGLTVMRALMAQLPGESFVYLGDTARLPYGTKSADTVTRYAVQCTKAIGTHEVKLLVVACNTAAAVAMDVLHATLGDTPVLGVIEPGADAAIAAAPKGKIAVIATESTVRGGAYVRAITTRNPAAVIVQKPCPLFVALAEEGLTEGDVPERVARHYLEPLLASVESLECLVLGCTHYPALAKMIARVVGPNVVLVDSAETTAQAAQRLLAEQSLLRQTDPNPPRFLATDAPERFARVGKIFLGSEINEDDVELVDL
jgi:glutamate racemase